MGRQRDRRRLCLTKLEDDALGDPARLEKDRASGWLVQSTGAYRQKRRRRLQRPAHHRIQDDHVEGAVVEAAQERKVVGGLLHEPNPARDRSPRGVSAKPSEPLFEERMQDDRALAGEHLAAVVEASGHVQGVTAETGGQIEDAGGSPLTMDGTEEGVSSAVVKFGAQKPGLNEGLSSIVEDDGVVFVADDVGELGPGLLEQDLEPTSSSKSRVKAPRRKTSGQLGRSLREQGRRRRPAANGGDDESQRPRQLPLGRAVLSSSVIVEVPFRTSMRAGCHTPSERKWNPSYSSWPPMKIFTVTVEGTDPE